MFFGSVRQIFLTNNYDTQFSQIKILRHWLEYSRLDYFSSERIFLDVNLKCNEVAFRTRTGQAKSLTRTGFPDQKTEKIRHFLLFVNPENLRSTSSKMGKYN